MKRNKESNHEKWQNTHKYFRAQLIVFGLLNIFFMDNVQFSYGIYVLTVWLCRKSESDRSCGVHFYGRMEMKLSLLKNQPNNYERRKKADCAQCGRIMKKNNSRSNDWIWYALLSGTTNHIFLWDFFLQCRFLHSRTINNKSSKFTFGTWQKWWQQRHEMKKKCHSG